MKISLWFVMPRPHLHVKPFRKSHVRRFSQRTDCMGRGYLVAVPSEGTRRGTYGVYIATFQ